MGEWGKTFGRMFDHKTCIWWLLKIPPIKHATLCFYSTGSKHFDVAGPTVETQAFVTELNYFKQYFFSSKKILFFSQSPSASLPKKE